MHSREPGLYHQFAFGEENYPKPKKGQGHISRRVFLGSVAGLIGLLVSSDERTSFAKKEVLSALRWTQRGPEVPELTAFSRYMQTFMRDHEVRAGSLAIVKDGKLVFAQSYTWAEAGYPITQPTSLFRIASCTKPLTSIAIYQLVEKDIVSLDTPMQHILDLTTSGGSAPQDDRFDDIHLWHLLAHMGGWDGEQTFDPLLYEARVARALGVSLPLSKYQIASYMASQPLQFAPGTRFAYSNFGYCLLGQIIEKLTGRSYQQALQKNLYTPLGLRRPRIGSSLLADRTPDEVLYHTTSTTLVPGVLSADQPLVPLHYGALNLANHDASGGQVMSAPDYAKILAAFDLEMANPLLHRSTTQQMWSEPPGAGANILYGWFSGTTSHRHRVIGHDGYLLGSGTIIFRRNDRTSFVVFFNRDLDISLEIDGSGNSLSNELSSIADSVTSWPKIDLFPLMDIPAFNIEQRVYTVVQNLPKYEQAISSIWFLLQPGKFH